MDRHTGKAEGKPEESARREFLTQCGRFAVVTPPAMTMLLSVTMTPSEAYASSVHGEPWDPRPKPKPRPKPNPKPKPKPKPKRNQDHD
jgi:hypothetical protein